MPLLGVAFLFLNCQEFLLYAKLDSFSTKISKMNKEVTQIKVFVSCPSDVKNEKSIVEYLCDEINQKYRDKFKVSLLMVEWEKSVIPQFGPRPQAIINQQISKYDVFIGIF